MADPPEFEDILDKLMASGPVEVREDGQWLAELAGLQYEVHREGKRTLLHLWSEERNLVRSILHVTEQSAAHLVLEVQRFGRRKPGRLEFVCAEAPRPSGRLAREKFRVRFRQILTEQFPDEQIDSLTTAPDLEHSFSGSSTRGILRRGQRAWAVMGVSPSEDTAAIDAILSFGLLWLDWTRQHAVRKVVEGLRLFLPAGGSRVTAHRMRALAASTKIQLYEMQDNPWRARAIDPNDVGNLATWLVPRREVEQTLAAAHDAVERIRKLALKAIDAVVPPGTREVAIRFRGLEFARWRNGKVLYSLPDQRGEIASQGEAALADWIRRVSSYRQPDAQDANHPLYRAQAERWLETMALADPTRLEAHLDPQHLYRQVPAFSGGDRGVIDLLGVTRDGRLVVIELKAAEDIHLALQGADYWLRVRAHQEHGELQKYGYFTGVELQNRPPLLYLVAPGFRFHPATDTILRYFAPEVQVVRVGLNENWRRGLQVVLRQ